MSDGGAGAGPWKVATFALAAACVVLGALLVLHQTGGADAAALTGQASKVAPATPVQVKMGELQGPQALAAAAAAITKAKLAEAGELTWKEAGVDGLTVEGRVEDASKAAEDGGTHVSVSVNLLVTKQPGRRLLAAFSATARVTTDPGTDPAVVEATKKGGAEAAAESVVADVVDMFRPKANADEPE